MFSYRTFLTIATIISHVLASPTSSAANSCAMAFDATYDDITVDITSADVPTPYLELEYIGWSIVKVIVVAEEPVSTLQPQSSPTTVFFNGDDDTGVHNFSIANGVTYFNLTSLYIGSFVVVAGHTPASAENVPTSCGAQAVGITLSGTMVSADLIFSAATTHALFTFPLSFSKLTLVNFVLTTTSDTSGLTAVDFDNVAYTVSTC